MGTHANSFILHLGLLFSGLTTMFSGLLIQINYHIGNHGNKVTTDDVFGINYEGWTDFHKISIVMLSALMIYHIQKHWKWYKVVIMKKLFTKNRQVIILSGFFLLAAITGIIPWLTDMMNGDEMQRKVFIEIHDKITLFLSFYLIVHVIKKSKWFFTNIEKMIK